MAIGQEGTPLVEGVDTAVILHEAVIERVQAHVATQSVTIVDHEPDIDTGFRDGLRRFQNARIVDQDIQTLLLRGHI